ncbi:EpsG family protein [Gammaproteobacteria bacterium]|nr:EpsG family protein [Gammaproteobacteria bacterium]
MTYIAIFISLIILRYSLLGQRTLQLQFYPIVLFLLFIFTAFRFQVGCDWSTYYQIYIDHTALLEDTTIYNLREPLWWLVMDMLNSIGASFVWLNVFVCMVFFLGVNKLARRSPDPLGFLVMLFPILIINMPMSALRQGVAIGLMCYAFSSFIDKKVLKFILFIIIAAGFHTSALVFLPMFLFINGEYRAKTIFYGALIEIPLLGLMYLSSYGESQSNAYIGSGYDAEAAIFRSGILFISALVFLFFYKRKWKVFYPHDYNLLMIGSLAMIANFFLVFLSTVISDRLGYYLIPIMALFFARVPFFKDTQYRLFFTSAPYLGLLLVFIVWTMLSNHFAGCYMPYKTWLFGIPGDII